MNTWANLNNNKFNNKEAICFSGSVQAGRNKKTTA